MALNLNVEHNQKRAQKLGVQEEFKGELHVHQDTRIGVVVSRVHESITRKLLKGCLDVLSTHDAPTVEVIWCPGAFELPITAQRMISYRHFHVVIALGAIIRGETYHFEAISDACIGGLQNVALKTGIPIALGVITPENLKQARARSESDSNHKGREAAYAAVEMAHLFQSTSDW